MSGTTTLQPAGLAEAFPLLSLCSAFALPIESANATSLRLDLFVTRTSSIHSGRTQNGPTGAPVQLEEGKEEILCLIFSPDSRWLLSAGKDAQARIWAVESNRLVKTFTNHFANNQWIYNAAFSPDSRRVVTASSDRTARVWDRETATELARFIHDDEVFAAEFNSDGTRLVTAGPDFAARIWDLDTKTCLQVLRHNARVVHATFSPTGKYLLTSCYDDVVRLWRLGDAAPAKPTNTRLILGGERSILRTNGVWSLTDASGSDIARLPLPNQLDVAFWFASDDRAFAATFPTNPTPNPALGAQCFDARTGAPRGGTFSVPQSWSKLIVSSLGDRVFAFNSKTGAVWNTISGERIHEFSNGCTLASFSPDGTLLALGRENRVEVLDMGNYFASLSTFSHPTNVLTGQFVIGAIEWDTAGHRLISSCWDDNLNPFTAQVWDARTGKTNAHPLAHFDGVLYATFNHGGTQVITCGEDQIAVLWDPTKGTRLAPPLAHLDQVSYAAFSGDDQLVATTTVSGQVTVWSAETGDRLTLPLALPPEVRRKGLVIRFASDNRALIIRDPLGWSHRWKLPYYHESLDKLEKTVGLLAAQQIDSTESLTPQTKENLRKLWESRANFLHPVDSPTVEQ